MKKLNEIEGIKVSQFENRDISLIDEAVTLLSALSYEIKTHKNDRLTAAFSSSLLTANSLLNMTSTKCTLKHPPEDIDVKVDSSGDLVYRCYHSPCHEWDLNGSKK
jgi:hypothetical protein